jgi:hypothetical protein
MVVKDEIVNIDSDWIYLFCFCDVFLSAAFSLYVACAFVQDVSLSLWLNRSRCYIIFARCTMELFMWFLHAIRLRGLHTIYVAALPSYGSWFKNSCFAMELKSVTLTFDRYVNGAGFCELTVLDFWFIGSPSCDLQLKICVLWIEPKSVTLAFDH